MTDENEDPACFTRPVAAEDLPHLDDQFDDKLPLELVSRPRKLARTAIIAATAIIVAFIAIGVLLKRSPAGESFTTGDQIGIAGIGIILGGLALLLARPRVWANAQRIRVRNVFITYNLSWQVVRSIDVPDGSAWAVLDLQDDEQVAILALQSSDGKPAVEAIRKLREWHAAAA